MGKFKTMLVGIALALPFATLNAASPVAAAQPAAGAAPPGLIEMGDGSAYTCCWVFYMGRWYCIPYC